VQLRTGSGGADAATAELTVVDPIDLDVAPPVATVAYGEPVSYTLSLTSRADTARSYSLTVQGLDGWQVSLPAPVALAPGQTLTTLVLTSSLGQGLHPFSVLATDLASGSGGAEAEAVLGVRTAPEALATLDPASQRTGPGTPARYHLTVTNTGSLSDTYRFGLDLPAGWAYRLEANGGLAERRGRRGAAAGRAQSQAGDNVVCGQPGRPAHRHSLPGPRTGAERRPLHHGGLLARHPVRRHDRPGAYERLPARPGYGQPAARPGRVAGLLLEPVGL
jgi:hypothetical protein